MLLFSVFFGADSLWWLRLFLWEFTRNLVTITSRLSGEGSEELREDIIKAFDTANHEDIIKAFDTANHELLFALLLRFGALEDLVEIIRRLHRDFRLNFHVGKTRSHH
jgi:hypothetical protein